MTYLLDISVVVPLYNEDESLVELVQWIDKVMLENAYSYEVILVDDGSTDNTADFIKIAYSHDERVSYFYKKNE
jgi:glycosyltransferase involved in cell wall biosynthesis